MEVIYLDKASILDSKQVGDKWGVLKAVQKELRELKSGLGGYPRDVARLENRVKELESKDFKVPVNFDVRELSDDPEVQQAELERFKLAHEQAQKEIARMKESNQRQIEASKQELNDFIKEYQPIYESKLKRIEELEKIEGELLNELGRYVAVEARPVLDDSQ